MSKGILNIREMSVNAAMIAAGFWKKKVQIPVDDWEAVKAIRKKYYPEESY